LNSTEIKYIEICKNDVYVEYADGDNNYLSFTKIKKDIYASNQNQFKYSCIDNEKSVKFLNTLLARYKIYQNTLIKRK
jgi:hypothetical protein